MILNGISIIAIVIVQLLLLGLRRRLLVHLFPII